MVKNAKCTQGLWDILELSIVGIMGKKKNISTEKSLKQKIIDNCVKKVKEALLKVSNPNYKQ